jgi:hypothetical protein
MIDSVAQSLKEMIWLLAGLLTVFSIEIPVCAQNGNVGTLGVPTSNRQDVQTPDKPLTIVSSPLHLRNSAAPEWSRYPKIAKRRRLDLEFEAQTNALEKVLRLRQIDVKQSWSIQLNGQPVGKLKKDQNDLTSLYRIKAGLLKNGLNRLEIFPAKEMQPNDDIEIGPIFLIDESQSAYLRQGHLSINVADKSNPNVLLPCRITLVDLVGSLVPFAADSDQKIAFREGVIYTIDGKVQLTLPAGEYRVFAGRGFEYSRDEKKITIATGSEVQVSLAIGRAVDTVGWVSCDTHVHTVTHSGHGDCKINERMLTLAGENIELPVATDHNKQIDYETASREMGARKYFTPLIGNEVTTDFGHFNSFPFAKASNVPNHRENDWGVLIPSIMKTPNVRMVILNHARDVHRGYRPFDPAFFNAVTGASLNERPFLFNGIEVINSAAQQSDPFQLLHDWMAIVNRGHHVIPIGSSDSHDVNKFIVGQGRTYIRCEDRDPGKIDVDAAMNNLVNGQVSVSLGLMAQISVNGRYSSGDLVPVATQAGKKIRVLCQMSGPHWVKGNKIQLFENGVLIREKLVKEETDSTADSFLHEVEWRLDQRKHDTFLTVLVTGPGVFHPSWPLAQPYQPVSPVWESRIFGVTGACFLDADGNGRFDSAFDYASNLVAQSKGDLKTLVGQLTDFDEAIAAQAAGLLQERSGNLLEDTVASIWRKGSPSVRRGFTRYLAAWRRYHGSSLQQ